MSSELRRQTRQTRYATLGLCGIGFAAAWRHQSLGMEPLAWIVGLGSAAGLLNIALLGRGDRARLSPYWCAHFSVATLFGVLLFSNLTAGGFYHPGFAWFYVVPMAAAAVLDLRSLWTWVGITIAACFGFWGLPYLGTALLPPVPEDLSPSLALLGRVSAVLALGVVATSFQFVQRRAARQLERTNAVLRRETAFVQLLQDVTVSANEAESPADAMWLSVARICTTMGWTGGQIYTVGPDSCLRRTARWQLEDSEWEAFEEVGTDIFPPGAGLPGRSLASRRPESIPDLSAFGSARADRAHELGLCSAVALPVLAHGCVVAVLEFGSRERVDVDQRFDEVLSLIGVQLGRVFERCALQDRLRQSQKMEAVGRLAAGLAHEINNPMAYVRSNLNQLYGEWERAAERVEKSTGGAAPAIGDALDECRELIRESRDGVERTIAIVRDVKNFAQFATTAREAADLNEIAESSIREVGPRMRSGLRIERELGELPSIRCCANQVQQVLVNLLANALQASVAGGVVRVLTGRDAEQVWVRVEDDGAGIEADHREQLFEPFFTTKPVGEGTGLGLYVSYEIVSSHDGEIRVQSDRGGTSFEVRLPIAGDASAG